MTYEHVGSMFSLPDAETRIGVMKLLIRDHRAPHRLLTNLGEKNIDSRKTARKPNISVVAIRNGKNMSHLYG
jgi:hypothetical protein